MTSSHLPACKPLKGPILMNHFLSITLPLAEFFLYCDVKDQSSWGPWTWPQTVSVAQDGWRGKLDNPLHEDLKLLTWPWVPCELKRCHTAAREGLHIYSAFLGVWYLGQMRWGSHWPQDWPGFIKVLGSNGEVGGGFRMGNTCKSMADSCQCMAKPTTIL